MGEGDHYSNEHSQASLPPHLCFFLLLLLTFVGLSWYVNYEPILESALEQLKLFLMVSPLLLLLALHLLSTFDGFSSYLPFPERDRAGGTPWGVAFLLVFLFFMLSYQSYFRETCFPLLG